MFARYQKTVESHAGADEDGTCRCKETSKMTPRELLGLMMSDLAFWKKDKKGSSPDRDVTSKGDAGEAGSERGK